MSDFGKILREKRRAAGLSQRQLADQTGVDFSYISKLENGRLPAPAEETIKRLSELLKCPAEELFAVAKKMPTELNADLTGQPGALKFLQEASKLRLSPDEWDELLGKLHGLRGEEGSQEE